MSSITPHPALMYNERNPWFHHDEVVVTDVPFFIIDTRDWRVRSRYVAQEVSNDADFVKGLESRCSFFLPRYRVPDVLDVHYARCRSEQRYAERVAGLPLYPFPSATYPTRDMLLLSSYQLGVQSDGSLAPCSNIGDQDYAVYRPGRQLRLYERRQRHRLGTFVSYQDRQVGGLHPRYIASRYWKLPDWWNEFEVPYHLAAQTPPVLTYRGLHYMSSSDIGWELILRAEWSAMCCVELYEQALEGFLWWLPSRVIDDIEALGVGFIFEDASTDVIEAIDRLLWEIRCIRWGNITNVNRYVPGTARDPTPSFDNGDFVEFNAANWCTELSSDMYFPLNHRGEPVGVANRGPRMYGDTRFWPSYSNPRGRAPGLDENDREPSYRLDERHGFSQSRWGVARSVVRNLAEQHEVLALRRDLGLNVGFDPHSLMIHNHELFLEKTESLRRGRQIARNDGVPLRMITGEASGARTPRANVPTSSLVQEILLLA